MYKIRLSDGTEIKVRFCAATQTELCARLVTDKTFAELAALFSDALKTATITYLYDSTLDTFCGYTRLVYLSEVTGGEYNIILNPGV